MATTIDMLMAMDIPEPATCTVRVPRLKMPDGAPLELTLRELSFSRVAELRERSRDFAVHTVLAGVQAPNLRDKALLDRFGVDTPAELVKKLFLPGEIEDLNTQIGRLCGYNRTTVELVRDVKKN